MEFFLQLNLLYTIGRFDKRLGGINQRIRGRHNKSVSYTIYSSENIKTMEFSIMRHSNASNEPQQPGFNITYKRRQMQ